MLDERLRAYLKFHLADGVGAVRMRAMLQAFGDVQSAARAGREAWLRVDGIGAKTADAIVAVSDQQIDEELTLAEEMGVAILALDDPEYPPAIKTIHDPPQLLYVRGRLEKTDAVAFAIVGSRRCTHYGLEQAERFGQLLARSGFTVISGGARGIDSAAHRGALSVPGRTIAVMGCGLSHVYPPENRDLFEKIVSDGRGALVSELPLRTAVLPGNFPTRNRIISGLSLGVLIVEAALKSGSLLTARDAAEQGRSVFALPGRVDSPLSQGTNELIRSGVTLVQTLDDILEDLGTVGEKLSEEHPEPSNAIPPGLDDTEQSLLSALSDGPLSLDELVRRTDLPSHKVTASMTMLVLKGHVAQQPGSVFARKRR